MIAIVHDFRTPDARLPRAGRESARPFAEALDVLGGKLAAVVWDRDAPSEALDDVKGVEVWLWRAKNIRSSICNAASRTWCTRPWNDDPAVLIIGCVAVLDRKHVVHDGGIGSHSWVLGRLPRMRWEFRLAPLGSS